MNFSCLLYQRLSTKDKNKMFSLIFPPNAILSLESIKFPIDYLFISCGSQKPWSVSDRYVHGKIWAIARLNRTSAYCKT